MNLRHFENTARQSFWMVHIEAWRRGGLIRTEYFRQHRLTKGTFDRWLTYLAGKESARKHVEYQAELRQQKRLEEREKRGKKRARLRYAVSTDKRRHSRVREQDESRLWRLPRRVAGATARRACRVRQAEPVRPVHKPLG